MTVTTSQVNQAFAGILRRAPSLAEQIGYATMADMPTLISTLISTSENQSGVRPIIRLYAGLFKRKPDTGGLDFWVQGYRAYAASAGGYSLANLDTSCAPMFTAPEYAADYPSSLTTSQYVTALYQNILHRTPDASGLAFWVNAIDNAHEPRIQVVTNFTEAPEFLNDTNASINQFQSDCANGATNAYTGTLFPFSY